MVSGAVYDQLLDGLQVDDALGRDLPDPTCGQDGASLQVFDSGCRATGFHLAIEEVKASKINELDGKELFSQACVRQHILTHAEIIAPAESPFLAISMRSSCDEQ